MLQGGTCEMHVMMGVHTIYKRTQRKIKILETANNHKSIDGEFAGQGN